MGNANGFQILRSLTSKAGIVVGFVFLLGACALTNSSQDPCALANRDASFSVLVENSMLNRYNSCLGQKRLEIKEKWRGD